MANDDSTSTPGPNSDPNRNIRERNGSYTVTVRKRGHKPAAKTFSTLTRAQRWRDKTESAIEEGTHQAEIRETLHNAIERYSADRELTTNQCSMIKWWDERLGHRRLSTLRRAHFIEARDVLRKMKARKRGARPQRRLTPATVNRRVAAISAVLTEALEWEWITTNPARIRSLKEDNERVRVLSEDERHGLIAACERSSETDLLPLVLTAMVSGARAGELTDLRWSHVDLERGIASLEKTKNKERRAIAIRGPALEVLKKKVKVRRLHNDHVFTHVTGRSPFTYAQPWLDAVAEAGIEDLRFHDLRHNAASELAMSGASNREIAALLGHRTLAMVKRYSHFFIDDHVGELGDRVVDRIFGESV